MTTRWMGWFGGAAAADLAAEYQIAGTLSIVPGRRATSSAILIASSVSSLTKTLAGAGSATMFQSAAIKLAALPSATRTLFHWMEGAITHVTMSVDAAGALLMYRGPQTTLLGSSAAVLTPENWPWVQVKVVIHDTTGSVEIRDAAGGVLLAVTGIDTRNGGTGVCDTVRLSPGGSGITPAYDEWHVWDADGSICNTWTNDTRIDQPAMTGAGNYAQWTPSAGANWECIDDQPWDTTTYVQSSTVGHKDSYTAAALTHNPPNIFGAMLVATGINTDAGARSIEPFIRRSSTDYVYAAQTLTVGSYITFTQLVEADPSTSAAWTQSGINAAERGIQLA